MTDRLHSCKESPDGRHRYWAPITGGPFRCHWCRKPWLVLCHYPRPIGRLSSLPPDSHLGAVEQS